MDTLTLSLPSHWLVPVLYGDTSCLDARETRALTRWLADTIGDVGHGTMLLIGKLANATHFARYHDAAEYGVAACDCYDVDLVMPATVPATAHAT